MAASETSRAGRTSILGPFLLAFLLVRLPLALVTRTPFQPDETWQSLEPAHARIFGYGHLTWEWRFNEPVEELGSWAWLSEGRLRGGGWVGVWAVVYWILQRLHLEEGLLTLAPKVVMAAIAAVCDASTYRLAHRHFGVQVAPTALLLSLTSLFHAHALIRPFTNSVETTLTTLALCWWPSVPTSKMLPIDSRRLSLLIGAVAITLRPTNLLVWVFLGLHHVYYCLRWGRTAEAIKATVEAVVIGSTILLLSTALDTELFPPPETATLPVSIPALAFFAYNLLLPTSEFYGTSPWHYYLTQALPILLTTALPWAAAGIYRSASGHYGPNPQLLAELASWTVGVYSTIGHKEWRFIHPILPVLHVLAANAIVACSKQSTKIILGTSVLRLPSRRILAFFCLAPLGPVIYLSRYHGVAQHSVIQYIRSNSAVTGLGVLMPCHSTPWQSHLHRRDIDAASWFLTCEPPKTLVPRKHVTEESTFYASPSRYLLESFPPSPNTTAASLPPGLRAWPSHLAFFASLLEEVKDNEGAKVKAILEEKGYRQVWSAWNGFDWAQDDEKRRGGVVVWSWVEDGKEKEAS